MSRILLTLVSGVALGACYFPPFGAGCPDTTCDIEEDLMVGDDWALYDSRCETGGECLEDARVRLEEDHLVLSYLAEDGSLVHATFAYDTEPIMD